MTFKTRILLAFSAILILNTGLVLVITLDRSRTSFESQGRDAVSSGLSATRVAIRDLTEGIERALDQTVTRREILAVLEDAAAGRRDGDSHTVVSAADRLRPPDLDLLRILDARARILSSTPDSETYGSQDRILAGLAGLGPMVRTLAVAGDRVPVLLVARRTDAGLIVVGGRRIDGALIAELSRRIGARVALGSAGAWITSDGTSDAPPIALPAVAAGARDDAVLAGDRWFAAIGGDLDGQLRVIVMRESGELRALKRRITRSAVAVGVGTLLLSWVVALLLTRGLSRPVDDLTRATARVARGEWDEPVIGAGGVREFDTLLSAFNGMQLELSRQREALRRAERRAAWRDAARRVAHEIKNALTPMQLAWERLRSASDSPAGGALPEIRDGARSISDQIESLRRIVGEFSELARWPEPRPEPLDLGALVRSTVEIYAGAEGATVSVDAGADVVVTADPAQVTRAIANLIQNALDAIGPGGSVAVRVWRDDTGSHVAVHDDGPGIPPGDLEKIFIPYYTTREDGTGLGLSIVDRVAEANGATIEAESEPGAGATFTLSFPPVGDRDGTTHSDRG